MKSRTPTIISALNSRTITGYVRALLIFARSAASFSRFVAIRSSASSRKPPVSPARIIAIMMVGKTLSCLPIAADSETPPSTSVRTSPTAFRRPGLAVCSSRTASDRSRDMPDAVSVANWRAETAPGLSGGPPASPGVRRALAAAARLAPAGSRIPPLRARRQRLGHHALQRHRQLCADLVLLVRRVDVDDPVDRLRGALGVQRGEDEVAGLGGGQRGRGRLQVAQLANQDDVGVLAQRVL